MDEIRKFKQKEKEKGQIVVYGGLSDSARVSCVFCLRLRLTLSLPLHTTIGHESR